MADIINFNDQDLKSKQGALQQVATGTSAPGGPVTTPAPQAPAASTPTVESKKGTGFTNISSIVAANQGGQLGQAVQSSLQGQQAKTAQDIQAAQQQFQIGLQQAGTSTLDQATLNTLATNPSALTDAQIQQIQNLKTSYAGPTSLAGAPQLAANVQNIVNTGSNLGSLGARQAALQQIVGSPAYGQQASALDATLLGLTGGQNLKNIAQGAAQLQNQLTQATNLASQQAQQQQANVTQNVTLVPQQIKALTDYATKNLAMNQGQIDRLNQIKTELATGTNATDAINKLTDMGVLNQGQANQLIQSLSAGSPISSISGAQQNLASLLGANLNVGNLAGVNQYSILDPKTRAALQALYQVSGSTTPTELTGQAVDINTIKHPTLSSINDIMNLNAQYGQQVQQAMQQKAQQTVTAAQSGTDPLTAMALKNHPELANAGAFSSPDTYNSALRNALDEARAASIAQTTKTPQVVNQEAIQAAQAAAAQQQAARENQLELGESAAPQYLLTPSMPATSNLPTFSSPGETEMPTGSPVPANLTPQQEAQLAALREMATTLMG